MASGRRRRRVEQEWGSAPRRGCAAATGQRPARAHTPRALAGLVLALLLGTAPPPARAQSCPPGVSRIPFAGHALPLDAAPAPGAMVLVDAYPDLFFGRSLFATAPPDGSARVVVLEQRGRVLIFEDRPDITRDEVVTMLDLQSIVDDSASELGLLGLAFDPDFAENGRFYVNYTASAACTGPTPGGFCTRIVRYEMSADPDRADPASATLVMEIPQNGPDHNGGMLAFGPDGYLYASVGDGGASSGTARDLTTPLGSLLRLDVREGAASRVPPSNPFADQPGLAGEIYHYGLRNPWRFSFDRATGDLWIGDVGDGAWEEIDFLPAGTPGGVDFGWDECEGDGHDARNGGDCSSIVATHTPPVHEYFHEGGAYVAVTGGYVYRGDAFPELHGAYLFADVGNLRVWAWDPDSGAPPEHIASGFEGVVSFGEDRDGEILLVEQPHVYRLERAGGSGGGEASFPNALSETGLFLNIGSLEPAPGLVEYDVSSPLWSDGTRKRRWMALPGDARIAFHARGAWDFPVGTAFVKHFEIQRGDGSFHRIETRVLLRQRTRWYGVTYRWNAAQTDALLLTGGSDELLDLGGGATQPYRIPSAAECMTCHNRAAGRVLGVRTPQLGRPFAGTPSATSQLETWSCLGLFDVALRNVDRFERHAPVADAGEPLLDRVRAYLDVNCAVCHQPEGPAPTAIDLRWETALVDQGTIGVPASEGDLGVPGADRIRVGAKEESVLWLRLATQDVGDRMAPGTRVPDAEAVSEIGAWIDQALEILDTDGDGVADAADGCPTIADPGQPDRDLDGLGDACDPDDLPRLATESLAAPGAAGRGDPVSLVASVRNAGGGVALDFPVGFYLSADAAFDPVEDASVATCWLDELGVGVVTDCATQGARIPETLPVPGGEAVPYYWVACADPYGIAHDPEATDECLVSASPILIPEPGRQLLGAVAIATVLGLARRRGRRLA